MPATFLQSESLANSLRLDLKKLNKKQKQPQLVFFLNPLEIWFKCQKKKKPS